MKRWQRTYERGLEDAFQGVFPHQNCFFFNTPPKSMGVARRKSLFLSESFLWLFSFSTSPTRKTFSSKKDTYTKYQSKETVIRCGYCANAKARRQITSRNATVNLQIVIDCECIYSVFVIAAACSQLTLSKSNIHMGVSPDKDVCSLACALFSWQPIINKPWTVTHWLKL